MLNALVILGEKHPDAHVDIEIHLPTLELTPQARVLLVAAANVAGIVLRLAEAPLQGELPVMMQAVRVHREGDGDAETTPSAHVRMNVEGPAMSAQAFVMQVITMAGGRLL